MCIYQASIDALVAQTSINIKVIETKNNQLWENTNRIRLNIISAIIFKYKSGTYLYT